MKIVVKMSDFLLLKSLILYCNYYSTKMDISGFLEYSTNLFILFIFTERGILVISKKQNICFVYF